MTLLLLILKVKIKKILYQLQEKNHSIVQEDYSSYKRKVLQKIFPKDRTKKLNDIEPYKIINKLVKFSRIDNTYHIIEIDNMNS